MKTSCLIFLVGLALATTTYADTLTWYDTVSTSADDAGCDSARTNSWGTSSDRHYMGYRYLAPGELQESSENLLAQYRFQGCTIPRGSRILTCGLGLVAADGMVLNQSGCVSDNCDIHFVVYTVDSGNAPSMAGESGSGIVQCAWSLVDEYSAWQFDTLWTDGVRQWQWNLENILQKVVVRPSYQAGNAIRFQICDEHDCIGECGVSNYVVVYSYDAGTTAYRPMVEATFMPPLVAAKIDYWRTDYSGELDSFWVAAEVGGLFDPDVDSIRFAVSTSDYPDSTTTITVAWPRLSSWATGYVGGISAGDGDSVYMTAWALIRSDIDPQLPFDSCWSERQTASMQLHEGWTPLRAGRTHITAANDTVVIAGTKLVCPDSGFAIDATSDYTVMLLGDDTLVWGRDSTFTTGYYWGPRGIKLNGDSTQLIGGYILHRPQHVCDHWWLDGVAYQDHEIDTTYCTPDSVVLWDWTTDSFRRESNRDNIQDSICGSARAIDCNGAWIMIDSVRKVDLYGFGGPGEYGGHTIYCPSYGTRIRYSYICNYIYGFVSRAQFESNAITLMGAHRNAAVAAGTYNTKVEGCRIDAYCHTGILASGGIATIEGNILQALYDTIMIDSRNMYVNTTGPAEHGRANAYAITFYGYATDDNDSLDGSYAKHCYITAGTDWQGGRGFNITGATCTEENPCYVDSNYIDVNEGEAVEIGVDYSPCGIKIRGTENKWWFIRYNRVIYTSDGTVANGFTGHNVAFYNRGHAIVWQQEYGGFTNSSPYHMYVTNNQFIARNRAGTPVYIDAVTFDKYIFEDTTCVWAYNFVQSDSTGYKFGNYDYDAWHVRIVGDTLKLTDSVLGHVAFQVGTTSWAGDDIRTTDMTYQNSDGDPAEYDISVITTDGDIQHDLNVIVTVVDGDSNPINGASITVTNDFGQTGLGTTNASGIDSIPMAYYHVGSGSFPDTTEAQYNPFTIHASYGAATADSLLVLDWDNKAITVQLGSPSAARRIKGVKKP